MADITSVDLARRVGENLEQTSPDLLRAERATGIEPALPAWKAGALPLSYARTGRPRDGGRHR